MDFEFSAEDEAFRAELRAFLDEELPSWWKTVFVDDDRAMPFTRELCKKLAGQGAHIIAVSSIPQRDRAVEAGADAFLRKPVEPLQLVSAVRDLLGTSALRASESTRSTS